MIPWLSPDALHPGWRRSPQAQSSQVRFMRTLLVSPDFIADEIPATGGHRRFIRRARSTTASSQTSVFLSDTVGTNLIRSVKLYPLNGSRGRSPLVRGFGGRTGPCFVSLCELKCPIQPIDRSEKTEYRFHDTPFSINDSAPALQLCVRSVLRCVRPAGPWRRRGRSCLR